MSHTPSNTPSHTPSNSQPAPEEVRDTLVPQDAPPDAALGDTLPPEQAGTAAPMGRRDPDVRNRPGLALGGGVALLAGAAALLPVGLVALLLWPNATSGHAAAGASPGTRPSVDFDALRAAIPSAPAAPLAAPVAAPGPSATRTEPDPTLHAFARLANRVYDAREVWRKSGQSGRELFRTATVDELGGAAFLDELKLGPRRFVWLRREAKVLAPASAQVPDGIAMKDGTNDPGPKVFDGTLDGTPVRAIRSCVFGETYCLVEVIDLAPAAASAAPAAHKAGAPVDDGTRLAAFDTAVERERKKLAAWSPPAASEAPSTTRAPPALALLAGLALAALLFGVVLTRLRGVASAVIGASARLRAAAAGQPRAAPAPSATAELALLQAAVDDAALAIGDGAARAELASRRRARLSELASALDAAAAGKQAARVAAASDDDVALAALVASVNVTLDRFKARPPAP